MDGKADEKSKSTQAPASCMSDVCIEAVSTSNRFWRIDLPLRKPCCLGSTQVEKVDSHAYRAELATIRLSVLTILSGLVFCG